MSEVQSSCTLSHPGFHRLSDLHFRLTEGDRVPAMVFELDGAKAVLPIPAVQQLFEIEAGCPDALTLNLIGSALRFVTCIRLGHVFPTEVISGAASWKPDPHHRITASSSLQLKLLRWISSDTEAETITPEMLLAGSAATKRLVNDAFQKAATELGIQGGAAAVASLVDGLTDELAYIEAMRERLLQRVRFTLHGLAQLERRGRRLPAARRETVHQVSRLMKVGITEIENLFAIIDAQTEDIILALRDLETQRSVLQPNRNWLYCMCIAWEEELRRWKGLPGGVPGEGDWHLVDSLYRFVAARFMKPEEWRKFDAAGAAKGDRVAMIW